MGQSAKIFEKHREFSKSVPIINCEMILSPSQIQSLAGGYQRPKDQLAELRKQGFVRARLGMDGKVVVESAHYEAVCSGRFALSDTSSHTGRPTPTLFRNPS